MIKKLLSIALLVFISMLSQAQHTVARQWNEAQLSAIREDLARPPVQARNLFHVSIAMYDAWAAYDSIATTYLLGKTVNGVYYPFTGANPVASAQIPEARNKAISYAAYRVLRHRYQNSPNAVNSLNTFTSLMFSLGYDINYTAINYSTGTPADLGNYIAQQVIQMGLNDSAHEQINYAYIDYTPQNPFLHTDSIGNVPMQNPNNWQPLYLTTAFDQGGNPVQSLQKFICPEWGRVATFALSNPTNYFRNGKIFPVYMDPGAPPMLDTVNANDSSSYYFKWGHTLVSTWSSHLSPDDTVMWDISPKSMGNVQSLPTTMAGQKNFYNYLDGGDTGTGYSINPSTGLPYTPQIVKRGDYTRVISQFWADGPNSETPPGHWYSILNHVNDNPLLQKKYEGTGQVLNSLEWDIKAYFTLGGAVHDAAIAAWGIKGWYDSPRPLSMIRKMAMYGQSSDPLLPSYHPGGITLVPGYIELVNAGDSLAGLNNINVGKIKLKSWKGFSFISFPYTDYAGVGWILAEKWMPYQRGNFVTPPFAGYISGHSTYSRASAEVLTSFTGSPYFPGGIGEYPVYSNSLFLVFENGPSVDFTLQWATYRDASNQSSLSRIWGGIHPPFDDIPGRIIGEDIGMAAHQKAKTYFTFGVVPVTLTKFSAVENNCRVNIDWETSTESNSASFTVLKSTDGYNFTTKVATVPAAGFSNSVKRYSIVDANPFPKNYYRLVQTDLDGKQKSFNIVFTPIKNCSLLSGEYVKNIWPNPAHGNATVEIYNHSGSKEVEIVVYDIAGVKQITQKQTLKAGNNAVLLKTGGLITGTYLVKVVVGSEVKSTQKLVKIN